MSANSLKERVLAAAHAAPSPTRAEWRARGLLLVSACAVLLVSVSLLHGPSRWFIHPGLYMPILSTGFTLVGAFLSGVLFGLFSSPIGGSRQHALKAARVAVPLLFAAALGANLVEPQTLHGPSEELVSHLSCPLILTLVAGVISSGLLYWLRRSEPISPQITALTIGAASGIWAALAVALQCHFEDPVHVLLTHVFPIVIVMWGVRRFGTKTIAVTNPSAL